MKKLITVLFFLIVGCGNPTPKIMPSQLPDANINEMYSQVIQISGGALDGKTTGVIINPTDSGLSWRPKTWNQEWNGEAFKKEDFHNITIYGKPLKKGRVTIKVSGFTYGTMYPGKDFNKTYEIEVN
nr:hypothetical protein [uncultured Moellerella sp.]